MKILLAIAATAALATTAPAAHQEKTTVADAAVSTETPSSNEILAGITDQQRQALQKVGIWTHLAQRELSMLNKDVIIEEAIVDLTKRINYDGTPARFQQVMQKMVAHMDAIKGEDRIEQLRKMDPEKVVGEKDNEYMEAIVMDIWNQLDFGAFFHPYAQRLAELDGEKDADHPKIKAIFEEALANAYALIEQGKFPLINLPDELPEQ